MRILLRMPGVPTPTPPAFPLPSPTSVMVPRSGLGLVSGLSIAAPNDNPGVGDEKPMEFNDVELRERFCCSNLSDAHWMALSSPSSCAIWTSVSRSAPLPLRPVDAPSPDRAGMCALLPPPPPPLPTLLDRRVDTSAIRRSLASTSNRVTCRRFLTLSSLVLRSSRMRRSSALGTCCSWGYSCGRPSCGGWDDVGGGAPLALASP